MRNLIKNKRFLTVFLLLGIIWAPDRLKAQNRNLPEDKTSLGSIRFGGVYKQANGLWVPVDTLAYLSYLPKLIPSSPYKIQVIGFQATLENSFILEYFAPQTHKRFRWGDSFLGQIGFGQEFSNIPALGNPIWGAYRFEIGMVGEYNAGNHFKAFLHWKPMVYEKDIISPYISGSSIGLNIQFSKINFGTNLLARDARVIGFVQALIQPAANPHDFEFSLGYQFNPKSDIQLKSRWYNPSTFTTVDQYPNQNLQENYSIQIQYGRLF